MKRTGIPIFVFFLCTLSAATELSDLAVSMVPGTWMPLNSTNIIPALSHPTGKGSGNIVQGANSAAWDENRNILQYIGKSAGQAGYKHVMYSESDNTWSVESTPWPGATGHGYDHNIGIDTESGTFYYRAFGSNRTDLMHYPVGGSWTQLSTWSRNGAYVESVIGTTFWNGELAGTSGKALIIYSSGYQGGKIQIYDIGSNVWRTPITGFGGSSPYNGMVEYSQAHNVAVLGGGSDGRNLWRLNADRTVTAMPDAPIAFGGYLSGNVVSDPLTGNFLFMGSGQLWELDPRGSGKWTRQTGSRVPPAAIDNPGPPDYHGVISTPIKNYGVILYVGCQGTNCGMYLYKHAQAASTDLAEKQSVPMIKLSASPNPFSNTITFYLPRSGKKTFITIYNIRGKRVARLNTSGQNEGVRLTWQPQHIAPGVYIAEAMVDKIRTVRKILFKP
jgi:hypothetical protein